MSDQTKPAGQDAPPRALPLDIKPYVEHHPVFGYRYSPGASLEMPRPGGGTYRIQVNSAGIRADREYDLAKPPGVTRIITLGDSMSAGQFVSNAHRFSELMERTVPGLEVMNLSLEGSGTDQQMLLYEHVGLKYEHDLVVLLPFLQNVRRNLVEAREAFDAKTGLPTLRPKPRYELVDGKLELKNVPVPAEAIVPPGQRQNVTDDSYSLLAKAKAAVSAMPGAMALKKVVYGLMPWEPFPEYRDPQSPAWKLMAAIVRRLKELAGSRPLVVAPTFYASYVRFNMAMNYLERYASLESIPGIYMVDLLPHFRAAGSGAVRCFQEPFDMHFSACGNIVLADALLHELGTRGFLPTQA